LVEFLSEGKMVNGLVFNEHGKFFNGAADLAAQLVAHFKKEAGGFYLYPTSAEDCGQDYEYHIYTDGEQHIRIKVMDCGFNMFGMTQDPTYEPLFSGNLEMFAKFCNGEEETDHPPMDTQAGKDWLKSVLRDSEVKVTFEKSDGTERVMRCTLKESVVPKVEVTDKPKRAHSSEVLPVWDIEASGWRSFRFDSIKKVEVTL
jgi:hypothetical protein